MRFALVAVLLLAACSSDPDLACTPGESRACSCSSGATGAQACDSDAFGECVCNADDAGSATDAGTTRDAGVMADASSPHDAASDDAPHDAGGPDGGHGYEGECTVVPLTGCGVGEACELVRQPDGFHSLCSPRPRGRLQDGETLPAPFSGCYERVDGGIEDACAIGLECSAGECARYCLVGGPPAQCPPLRGEYPTECRAIESGFPVGFCTWVDAP